MIPAVLGSNSQDVWRLYHNEIQRPTLRTRLYLHHQTYVSMWELSSSLSFVLIMQVAWRLFSDWDSAHGAWPIDRTQNPIVSLPRMPPSTGFSPVFRVLSIMRRRMMQVLVLMEIGACRCLCWMLILIAIFTVNATLLEWVHFIMLPFFRVFYVNSFATSLSQPEIKLLSKYALSKTHMIRFMMSATKCSGDLTWMLVAPPGSARWSPAHCYHLTQTITATS